MSMVMDGYSVSDKATRESKSTRSDAVVVDLGVKLQRIESFPCKMMMMMGHHDNHHRPFYEIGDGDTCNNRAKSSNIYDVVGVGGVSGAAVASGGAAVGVRALQPFDISPTKSTATATTLATHTAFKSPGGMAASLGFPFTSAQWKELERQAMIYKYMMASLPVPSDLLFPILRHPSIPATSHPSLGSGLNLRFSKGGDQEPGRCRRTDGKKWRCSRDVAPDQKYCERHMHRGRPRSRKHVELPANNKKTRINGSLPTSSVTVPAISNNNGSTSQFVGSIAQSYRASTFEPVTSASSYKEPRSLDWMMKGETVPMPTTDQQWQHLMQQTKIGLNIDNSYCDTNSSSVLNQRYREEPLNLNSYASFNAGKDHSTTQYPLFLNPNLISHTQTPRGFIDAWSNHGVSDDHNANSGSKSSVSSNGKLSLSALTLSMGGNSFDEDMSQNHECGTKSSSWLTPSSWTASTPGGPLAEVLRPSKVSATIRVASKPSSPIAGDGDLSSPPATAVSSPSGVLQKTLASLSDSSGSSSPTLASSSAKPEIALMWLKQGNLASSVLGRE